MSFQEILHSSISRWNEMKMNKLEFVAGGWKSLQELESSFKPEEGYTNLFMFHPPPSCFYPIIYFQGDWQCVKARLCPEYTVNAECWSSW